MSPLPMLLTRLEVILALLALLAAVKSAYNGVVRGLVDNIREIPSMSSRVDEIGEKQEEMIDGMIALSIAESDEYRSVDTERLASSLRDGNSYRVFLQENGSNPYADVEDEEEVAEEERRWREQDDD